MKRIYISLKDLLHTVPIGGILKTVRKLTVFLIPVIIFSSCMKDDYEEVPQELCPDIEEFEPTGDEVAITRDIKVTFNKKMCPELVSETFTVERNGVEIDGAVHTTDSITFVFRPDENLQAKEDYTAIVTTGVADCYGLTLIDGDFEWGFRTKNEAPQIIKTYPDNNQTEIPRNPIITIEFDRELNINTLDIDKFDLSYTDIDEDIIILDWEYSNRIIRIFPDNFEPNQNVQAVLKGDVEDLLGYFIEDDYTWSFETGPQFELIPRSVNLRSLSEYAIFASEKLHNDSVTEITGDVGIIPGFIGDITGDPLIFPDDSYGIIADGDNPLPGINPDLIKAKNDLVAAYLFAEHTTDPEPKELIGDVFTPGIYYDIDNYNMNQNITLDAEYDRNAFWIFQISDDLIVNPGIQIILKNGAHANNVFWQVGNKATINENAVFKGTIMAKEDIELKSGVNVTGRLMVKKGRIDLDTNTIMIP